MIARDESNFLIGKNGYSLTDERIGVVEKVFVEEDEIVLITMTYPDGTGIGDGPENFQFD